MTIWGITFDMALLNDAVQIFILYLVFYWLLRAARGSRFGQVLTGVGLLFAALIAFTYLFHFSVLSRIVQGLLFYLALSSVVIFQPEIRRILATIGSLLFLCFCMHKKGWGWDGFIAEADAGKGLRFPKGKAIQFYLKWIAPPIILVVFIAGYFDIFGAK